MKKTSKLVMLCLVGWLLYGMLKDPNICISGAKGGLLLWFEKVLPSLLPFMIIINILSSMGVVLRLLHKLSPITQKCFGISGNSFFVFVMGLIAGYPSGARLSAQLVANRTLSFEEAQKTLLFANNSGPLFIIGTVGTILLGNTQLGYFLLFIHILSALSMLLLSRFYQPVSLGYTPTRTAGNNNNPPLTHVFTTAVQNGMDTIVYVGAYIIFFSVIISLLKNSPLLTHILSSLAAVSGVDSTTLTSILLGSLEMSNGVALLAQNTTLTTLSLLSALLAFGGFCVLFQSISVVGETPFRWGLYMLSKVVQAILAYSYTKLLYPLFFVYTPRTSTLPTLLLLGIVVLLYILYLNLSSRRSLVTTTLSTAPRY